MRRVYGWLLRLYPARFREEYASSMERDFQAEYREARTARERLALVWRALADVAATAPGETAREVGQDLRFAARACRRRPLATGLAVTTLAMAIGATTGTFSVLNALLIRPLPFAAPEQLAEVTLAPVNVAHGRAAFQAWQDNSSYLAAAAGFTTNEMNVSLGGQPARVRVTEATANFLRLLGAEPALGRGFAPEEDRPGHNGVAVISDGLWRQVYGRDPQVIGSLVRLNGKPFTVVGVAPRGMDFPDKTAVWTPTVYELARIPKSGAFAWRTIGRLKPGLTTTRATALFQAEVQRAGGGPGRPRIEGFSSEPSLTPLRDVLAGPVQTSSLLLMGMAAFVLLIACANLAHLLLSRITERRQELVIRAALGASRARLVQQLVTEATALTAVAALAGLGVAHWAARLAELAVPAQLAARPYTVLDWRVAGFTAGLALLTGLLFGVLPATLLGRMQPGQDVMRAQTASRGAEAARLRTALTAMQAALTVALLAAAFGLGGSFLRLMKTDLAFRTAGVVTLNVSLAGTRQEAEGRERAYFDEALARLRAAPGVESAAAVAHLPLLTTMFSGGRYRLDSGEEGRLAVLNAASPGYFHTVGTPVLQGRDFQSSDHAGSEPVAVISDDLARSFGRGDVLGRRLNLGSREKPGMVRVIGIVPAQRIMGPAYPASAQIFRPLAQATPSQATFVARTGGEAAAYVPACRDVVQQVDRSVPVYDVKLLGQRLDERLARPRFYTAAIVFLAGFALLLAVAGTYGVAAYSVGQRTREIGIRIAVGSSPAGLRAMLFRQGMAPVAAGMVGGAVAAAGAGRLLRHLVAGAEPAGPALIAAASAVLALAAGLALWQATRRITRLDPTLALRAE